MTKLNHNHYSGVTKEEISTVIKRKLGTNYTDALVGIVNQTLSKSNLTLDQMKSLIASELDRLSMDARWESKEDSSCCLYIDDAFTGVLAVIYINDTFSMYGMYSKRS